MKDCEQDKLLEGHSSGLKEIPQPGRTFYTIIEPLHLHEACVFVWVASLISARLTVGSISLKTKIMHDTYYTVPRSRVMYIIFCSNAAY